MKADSSRLGGRELLPKDQVGRRISIKTTSLIPGT